MRVWDYFGLKCKANGEKQSMTAVLLAEPVTNECGNTSSCLVYLLGSQTTLQSVLR